MYDSYEPDAGTFSRREALARCGLGFGSVMLGQLLAERAAAETGAASTSGSTSAAGLAASSALAPKTPHFAPKAKRVVHFFLNGGPSQVDTFDPKPALEKYAGKMLPTTL